MDDPQCTQKIINSFSLQFYLNFCGSIRILTALFYDKTVNIVGSRTLNNHSSSKFAQFQWNITSIMNKLFGLLLVVVVNSVFAQTDEPLCSNSCRKYETYTQCSGDLTCQESCNNANILPTLTCGCIKGCQCQSGFVRDPYTMKCIAKGKCGSIPFCPVNEEWSDTMANCQITCSAPNTTFSNCQEGGCICQRGFIRRSDLDRTCIPIEQCNGRLT